MILDKEKIEKALEIVNIKLNEKHIYDAIVNTHSFRFCLYDNVDIEIQDCNMTLEETMKIGEYMVFVHACSSLNIGLFFALKIIKFQLK